MLFYTHKEKESVVGLNEREQRQKLKQNMVLINLNKKNMVILNKQKRMIRMKKAIFSIIISLILVLTATGCSNSSKEKPIKKSALEINPTSKAVNITVNKKENNNAKEITNDGIKKDTKDTLIWKGVANKYDNVKDLLGESILYEVKYKNGI